MKDNTSTSINPLPRRHKISEGEQYGTWEVVKNMGTVQHNCYYLCRCIHCGTEKLMKKHNLVKGNGTSCKNCGKDYSGQIYNGWEILKRTNKKNKSRNNLWLCRCIHCGDLEVFPTNYFNDSMPVCDCSKGNGKNNIKIGAQKKFSDEMYY